MLVYDCEIMIFEMKYFWVLMGMSVLCCLPCEAQKKSPLQASYMHQFGGDDGGGSVTVDRWSMRGGVPLILDDGNLLALGFRYSMSDYDFDGTLAEWGRVNRGMLGLASRWRVNDEWLWGNYGAVGFAAEEGARVEDGISFSFVSMGEYRFSDRLMMGPGVGVSGKIDRGMSIFPVIAIKWDISDEWMLASGPSEVAETGANLYLDYRPRVLGDRWVFSVGGSFGSQSFKLDASHSGAPESGEEKLGTAYAAASYQLERGLKFSLVSGYHFYQSYETYAGDGGVMSEEDLGGSMFVGVSVGVDF